MKIRVQTEAAACALALRLVSESQEFEYECPDTHLFTISTIEDTSDPDWLDIAEDIELEQGEFEYEVVT